MSETATERSASVESILGQCYRPPDGVYDEMVAADGTLRPHWMPFVTALAEMGWEEFDRRWDEARRLIRENGVTYNVYGDPRGMDRPWELDAIPLIIDPAEWKTIQAALVQRAQLLNMILLDIYGPQKLLREGLLPPELVFAHPGFLRPCHGIPRGNTKMLQVYAVELARSPDGTWWILSDRTQNPSGAGYALENRSVLLRAMPNLLRQCQVVRLMSYFSALRGEMVALAPQNRDNPRIVLLTPGPYNETYFEHSYLARHLGYTLVEGGDLTVRDDCVFLKTLQGLRRVDVVLRRLDDNFCDPLELRNDSLLGVPGLVGAAHAGSVRVVNPLGSGVVESAALMPFLPGLCRHLLDEDIRMPSVATWWCGQEYALEDVAARLSQIVVKPAFPAAGIPAYFGELMTEQERSDLVARMRERPWAYAGQERVALSTAPSWTGSELQPRHLILRVHIVATKDGYTVMPGGLTRISAASDSVVVSMQNGGGSKDAWVLASEGDSVVQAPQLTFQPVEVTRGDRDVPSRVADNLYWLGRYVERAELAARLLRAILKRISYEPGGGARSGTRVLIEALVQQKQIVLEPGLEGTSVEALEGQLIACALDDDRPSRLGATLNAIHGVAFVVRDRVSSDAWRILRQLEQEAQRVGASARPSVADVLEYLDRLVIALAAFSGLGTESMTRGQGWRILDAGRRIERAYESARLLRATVGTASPAESFVLDALLEIGDSSMTYRSRYRTGLQFTPVIDLLLTDESNPRSIAFQIAALAEHVANLPRNEEHPVRRACERVILSLLTELRLADIYELTRTDDQGGRAALSGALSRLLDELPTFSDALTRDYLTHANAAQQFTSLRADSAADGDLGSASRSGSEGERR